RCDVSEHLGASPAGQEGSDAVSDLADGRSRSTSAQDAKQRAPTAPVAVSRAPAAAVAATPFAPRMTTAAAAPRLGPTGSRPITATPIRSAVASRTELSTPIPWRTSQLRAI